VPGTVDRLIEDEGMGETIANSRNGTADWKTRTAILAVWALWNHGFEAPWESGSSNVKADCYL